MNSEKEKNSLRSVMQRTVNVVQAIVDNQATQARNMEHVFDNLNTLFKAVKDGGRVADEVVLKAHEPIRHRHIVEDAAVLYSSMPTSCSKLKFPLKTLAEFRQFYDLLESDAVAAEMANYLAKKHGSWGLATKTFTLAALSELFDIALNKFISWSGTLDHQKNRWTPEEVAERTRLSFTEQDADHRIERAIVSAARIGCGEWPDAVKQRGVVQSGISSHFQRRLRKTGAQRERKANRSRSKRSTKPKEPSQSEIVDDSDGDGESDGNAKSSTETSSTGGSQTTCAGGSQDSAAGSGSSSLSGVGSMQDSAMQGDGVGCIDCIWGYNEQGQKLRLFKKPPISNEGGPSAPTATAVGSASAPTDSHLTDLS
jgi:hypothetical protein